MLVQFTTTDGREIWINPIHVKAVRAKTGLLGGKKNATEIWLGWTSTSESIDVPMSPAEVATLLNAATPAALLPAFLESEDDPTNPRSGD
jgi:hypothetical protein